MQYRYNIELRYVYNNNEVVIDNTNIHSLMVDYDYDGKNMPIMILKVSMDKNLIDDMIKNSDSKHITLILSKYILDSEPQIKEDYIKGNFIYFLDNNNLNYQKDLDYSGDTKESEDIYRMINIGLVREELINNNKLLINDIHNNSNMNNIILYHLSHMRILMEPSTNNEIYERLIIPPISSITELIKYLDDIYSIYDTPYRLFYDYDKTYLLSSSGKAIQSKEELYTSIIININNTLSSEAKYQGMYTNKIQKAYILDVDQNDIKVIPDKATIKSYNTIIGINSNGDYEKVSLNLQGNNKHKEKVRIERMTTGNLDKIKSIKSGIENNSFILNLIKNDLDSSLFTINKQYFIKDYNKQQNDRFLLKRKREIYTRDNGTFILTNLLTFKKINPST